MMSDGANRFSQELANTAGDEILTVDAVTDDGPHWLSENADALRSAALERGAVLVRGLRIRSHADAAAASRALTSELMQEVEGFAPRKALPDGVYSSSEWPPDQPMCMHHELTSAPRHPRWMVFSCLSAGSGGTVSVADAAKVLDSLPAGIVEAFEREGWLLARTYDQLVGLSSADAFGTADPDQVDAYCRAHGIEFHRTPGGVLRTRQKLPAVVTHPQTGRRCWFNQIAFLNEWTMDPAVRSFLVGEFGAEGLPFTTLLGDGTPLEPATVEAINETYDKHAVPVPWNDGDLLLVDNIGTAHSRAPHGGSREVVVALGDPQPRFTA